MKIYISIYLLFIITLSTQAKTYYVAPDGNNINKGNFQNPWKTIKYGISKLKSGDTLYIRAGKYRETFSLKNIRGSEENPITVSGYPGERPEIDGKDLVPELWYPLIGLENCEYIIFQNLEVVNSRGRGIRVLYSDHITIRDIWLHHLGDAGVEGVTCGYLTIENCRIWKSNLVNDEDGPWYEDFMWSGAVSCYGDEESSGPASHDIVVRGNEIFQNYGEGINMEGHNDGVVIENNTVWDSWAPAIHFPNSKNILIQRNLLYHTNDPEFLREGQPSCGIAFLNEVPPTKPGTIRDITVINNLVMGYYNNIAIWEDERGDEAETIENVLIANNTLLDAHSNTNKTESIFILNTDIKNIRIENNIILQEDNTGIFGYCAADSGVSFSHNLWWPGYPPHNIRSKNDVFRNALIFRSGLTGPGLLTPDYFKIGANSPAIGAGKILPEVTEDFSGRARTGTPAIGAFEYDVPINISQNNNYDKFIEIYPNPVFDKFNVAINNNEHHIYTLNLFDINGRLVMKKLTNDNENNVVVFDVRSITSGVYVLNVLRDDKIQTNKKIIIE